MTRRPAARSPRVIAYTRVSTKDQAMRIELSHWEGMLVGVAIAEALRASPHLFDDEEQREALWGVEEQIKELLEDEPPLTQDQYDRLVAQNRRLMGVPPDAPYDSAP